MNTTLFRCAAGLALSASAIHALDAEGARLELSRVAKLDEALTQQGVLALPHWAEQNSIPVPPINSQLYSDKLVRLNPQDPETKTLEANKRSFGKRLALALDDIGIAYLSAAPSSVRKAQAEGLFSLSRWLRSSEGYGNYWLAARSENLAIVPLAYLACDLSVPVNEVTAMEARFLSTRDDRSIRRTVLIAESGASFVPALVGTDDQQDMQMYRAWGDRWKLAKDWLRTSGLSPRTITESAAGEHAVFLFESPNGPQTTSDAWDYNRHASLVFGPRDIQMRSVHDLIRFRIVVGSFPTTPPKWWKPSDLLDTALEAAFKEAWLPHMTKEKGVSYDSAARVYSQVTAGKFVDSETELLLSQRRGSK
jgi:hypothetical protein